MGHNFLTLFILNKQSIDQTKLSSGEMVLYSGHEEENVLDTWRISQREDHQDLIQNNTSLNQT